MSAKDDVIRHLRDENHALRMRCTRLQVELAEAKQKHQALHKRFEEKVEVLDLLHRQLNAMEMRQGFQRRVDKAAVSLTRAEEMMREAIKRGAAKL